MSFFDDFFCSICFRFEIGIVFFSTANKLNINGKAYRMPGSAECYYGCRFFFIPPFFPIYNVYFHSLFSVGCLRNRFRWWKKCCNISSCIVSVTWCGFIFCNFKHCCHFLILSSNGFYARATLSIQNNLEHWCEDDLTRVAVRVACFEMHVFVSIVSFTYGANVNTIDRFFFFCSLPRKWCHAQCHAHTD